MMFVWLRMCFICLFVMGGPEGAWRGKKYICKGRAGWGVEAEAYFYWGWTGSGCGGGRGVFP